MRVSILLLGLMKTRHQHRTQTPSSLSKVWSLNLKLPKETVLDDLKGLSAIPPPEKATSSPARSKSTQLSAVANSSDTMLNIGIEEMKDRKPLLALRRSKGETINLVGKRIAPETETEAVNSLFQFCKDLWSDYNPMVKEQGAIEERDHINLHNEALHQYTTPIQNNYDENPPDAHYTTHSNQMANMLYDFYSNYLNKPMKNSHIHVATAYGIYQDKLNEWNMAMQGYFNPEVN